MDLSLLQSLRQQSSQLASQRHEKSDEAYQQALQALAQAQASGFQDKAALKLASQQFLKAIQMARGKAEPYVGMAYLLLLLGQQKQAVRYLNQAKTIDPEHQDAHKLLQYLQDPAAFAPVAAAPTTPGGGTAQSLRSAPPGQGERSVSLQPLTRTPGGVAAPAGMNVGQPDTHRMLREQLTTLSYEASKLPLNLMVDRKQLKQARTQLSEWEDRLEVIQDDIMELEAVQNVNSLQRAVQVLERRIEQLDKLCRDSAQICQIYDDILDTQLNVRNDLRSADFVADQAERLEQRLESYLDECDRIADLIDESEERGLDVQTVVVAYEALTSDVERFQDAVDDLK